MNNQQVSDFWVLLERIARALEGLLELAESAAQATNDEEG